MSDLHNYFDARLLTEFNPDDPIYKQKIVASFGPNSNSKRWAPDTGTADVATLFRCLAEHREGPKDGLSIVLGDIVPGRRVQNAMKALYAIGLDFDLGTSAETIDGAMVKLGCACLRYTTHSNETTRSTFKRDEVIKFAPDAVIDTELMRRFMREERGYDESIASTVEYLGDEHSSAGIMVQVSHAPMPKNRVVIPLASPFVIAGEGTTQKEALEKWHKVPVAMAELMGLRDAMDMTGKDASRLFYLPRHAKNRPWEITLCGGPLFDWNSLELDNPYEKLAEIGNRGSGKSKTPEGKALGAWAKDHAGEFQIADVIEAECSERIRNRTGVGIEIECPFDSEHSNAGDPDDRACLAINAGYGNSPVFTISCRHESCRGYTMLDMLGKMLADGLLPEKVLKDESLNAAVSEDAPQPEAAERIEREDNARAEYRDAIDKLTPDSTDDDVDAAILKCLQANLPLRAMDAAFTDIAKKTKTTMTTIRKMVKDCQRDLRGKESDTGPNKNHLARLSDTLGKPFELPPKHVGSFGFQNVDGALWMIRLDASDDGYPQKLCTPFMLLAGINYVDRGENRGLRAAVQREDGTWREIEIDPGEIAAGGKGSIATLRRAGLQMTRAGWDFISNYLLETQPPATTVYHRAGFRGGRFVCPTGEVLLADKDSVELAQDIRLKCSPRAGSLEAWKEGASRLFALPVKKAGQIQSGLLMGLSGTLTDLAKDDPLAFALEGASSHGKSTSQEVAVAHWCNPSVHETDGPNGEKGHGLFRPAKGTANSLEGLFEIGSGTVTAYDEIGKLAAKDQQDLMFMNQAASGKNRMNADGTMRKSRTWGGTALIVSAETGFAQRLRMENVAQLGGLSARLVTVQVDQFELLDPKTEWPIIESIKANYGHAGPAFIRALDDAGYVNDPDKLRTLVSDHVGQLPAISEGSQPAFRRRVARPIGYLWAAGKIAADAGLIPANADIDGLMHRLWDDVLKSDIGPTDAKARAVVYLLDQITSLKGSSIINFQDRDDRQSREVVGYWGDIIPDPDDKTIPCPVYVVRNDKLADLSGGFADVTALRKELETLGILIRNPATSSSRTWSGYRGLGKNVQYVVLRAAEVDE